MFSKILIANRGEIAVRVARTAKRLGVRTVAVYSDADANAMHVAECDEAVHIGGAAAKESYLLGERVIAAAKATGAQAIHPGYGFLSENEAFAERCATEGLVFIGPPASAIEAMGLKSESKRLMAAAGVPLVPGYHGADQSPELLAREAARIGFPVLIKASAGGGGKGMKPAHSAAEFSAALESAKREAKNSFGNDDVLIEKYLQKPRHIEIQVFADTLGNCVYLFERDCSVQRRHQKVLEEAPAPGLSAAQRTQMGEAACAAAKAVGYVGAGTVEFIFENDTFYFMEMNTRLQVEHPVTEAITGEDLVEWQLRVASRERLPKLQSELRINGYAIEARVYAEDADKGFLPAIGTIEKLRIPAAQFFTPGEVRIDSGVREGDAISPFYDPMIAKLITHGSTRAQALARMRAALQEFHVMGLTTNLKFLDQVVAHPAFAAGGVDTSFIAAHHDALFPEAKPLSAHACAALAASQLPRNASNDPWEKRNSFWLGQPEVGSVHRVQCGDASTEIEIVGALPNVRLRIDGGAWQEAQVSLDGEISRVSIAGDARSVRVIRNGNAAQAQDGSNRWLCTFPNAYTPAKHQEAASGHLRAPMPGTVIAVLVQVGQAVESGAPLLVMEAMKMEHTITAPKAGKVAALYFKAGEQVKEGEELLHMESTES
jgi:3-methylcrotonyl-CoA carboxylase alpha subunit